MRHHGTGREDANRSGGLYRSDLDDGLPHELLQADGAAVAILRHAGEVCTGRKGKEQDKAEDDTGLMLNHTPGLSPPLTH